MPTIGETLETITARLARAGVPSPRADAEALIGFATGLSRTALILDRNRELEPGVFGMLEGFIQRRENREPLQWILGHTNFYGLELFVRPGVLVPRPETERLVEIALDALREISTSLFRVVDIGTGTGAIALALKHERPRAEILATDIDPRAVSLTRENAEALKLEIGVSQGDLLGNLRPPFDAIISNPPYLMDADFESLEPEVQRDPHTALFSGADGLGIARRIVDTAKGALKPGGFLALELDPRNVHALATELENTVWDNVIVHSDLSGRERFLTATLTPGPSPAGRGGKIDKLEGMFELPAIALDVGEARIGFAASDPQGRFAFGRGYHTRTRLEADVQAVRELLTREGARTVVVGLPLRTDGADSPQTQKVRIFAAALQAAGLPIAFQDERFTTRIATQNLSGKSKKKRQEKGSTDEASAIAILETWLSKRPRTE